MAGDPAELAYGHALAILGNPDSAADVAITALRRAGRARALVLAHARHEAVTRAALEDADDLTSVGVTAFDVSALAAKLASTRPVEERAALDLRARTGGDLAALGAAVGARPSAAVDRCSTIAETWERTLDPALLAFSGPGDCEGLAEVLRGRDLDTVADLLAVVPAVHAHVQDCTACADRVRAMASVRSSFGETAVEVPAAVREVSRVSRTKRPSASPPPLFAADALAAGRRRRFTPPSVAAALMALVAVSAGVTYASTRNSSPGALTRLTRLSKSDALSIGTPAVAGQAATVTLHNHTDKPARYTATTSTAWAHVEPDRGVVAPHSTRAIVVRALEAAPEGEDRAILTVTTASGASTAQELRWTLEHPPDLDASATGCAVDVNVVEEGKLTSLVLHWRDAAEHDVDITDKPDGYQAELKPNGAPITYWVTAVDERGNQSRTADQVIAADAC